MNSYTRYSSQASLSDSTVLDIRAAGRAKGATSTSIGQRFGIDRTTAARILTYRTWGHVPSPISYGKYSVYPDGRVYSTASGRFLKQTRGSDGQNYVQITVNGASGRVSTASLVAKTFLKTKSKNISFRNGNRSDAHFTNLKIATK
jgi:hypothetical protein